MRLRTDCYTWEWNKAKRMQQTITGLQFKCEWLQEMRNDIWVPQMRTVQKPRQKKVKKEHHGMSEKSISIEVWRVNSWLKGRKTGEKGGRGGIPVKQRSLSHTSEMTQIFPYFKKNHRKQRRSSNNYNKILF